MPESLSRFARGTGAAARLRPSRAKSQGSRIARLAVPVAAAAGLLAFQSAGVTVTAAAGSRPTPARMVPWRFRT